VTTAAERLHLLYEVNRRLTSFTDLDELVRYATRRTRELFGAEGCALLLVDRARKEFYFPVSSQSASSQASEAVMSEIRFPVDRGIAGWVLANDKPALVGDTSTDPRFYRGVDQLTHMATRAVLCAPLHAPSGNVGVVEVVNPDPAALTLEDLEFLEALATDIALAHEKALLYEQLRGEVIGLRQACRFAGFGLLAVGTLLSLGLLFRHVALALPLSELLVRPGLLASVALILAGVMLVGVGRGWFGHPAAHAAA
jgi:GAF domain-containing protein